MVRKELEVEENGLRIDVFLHKQLEPDFSRRKIQEMIREGKILVNGGVVKCHYRIKRGDIISIEFPEREEPDIEPEEIPLEIIFEDEHLLVVNKPAGMLVHPAGGIYSGTLVNALIYHSQSLSTIGGKFKPGIVHRLDKDTSGLMVVAKSDQVHLELASQFKEHQIYRRYIAIVKGVVELDEGKIDVPLGRHPRDRERMSINFSKGRKAETFYRVLKRYPEYTLLEAYPKTGRTHQIRVHLSYLGYPVLGDPLYGRKDKLINRQALHAQQLGFKHPFSKEKLKFSSALPSDMQRLIQDYVIKDGENRFIKEI
ncbi:MAG: RluA family pseudouridine synthase [Candidatus Omnitrophica bacterium]|nr:RluA family pseudouridine synthase [Candidatus Omnitrophota bacterium]MCM8793474.1 RluA family pseudouridine synthase [Candidatus Omnitrophota bacterium]